MNILLLFTLLLSNFTQQDVEKKILILRPDMSVSKRVSRLKMISKTVSKWAPKAGFTSESDLNLIVAMMKKESDFNHIAGTSGEWGMLQVIPSESHIRRATLKYRCTREEAHKCYSYKTKKGHSSSYCLCRKSNFPGDKIYYPNIGRFYQGMYKPLIWKTRLFLRFSQRGAIAVGLFDTE